MSKKTQALKTHLYKLLFIVCIKVVLEMKMYFIEVFIWTFAIYGFVKFVLEFWLDFSVGVFNIAKGFIRAFSLQFRHKKV